MSVAIYTVEAQVSIYDDVNQRWGGYTDAKNLLSLQITKPEPTRIKDVSSRPDDTFAQTVDSYLISQGSPEITLSTRDVVNRDSLPVEMELLAAALSARQAAMTKAAATDHYFSAEVTALELNYDTGDRNLAAASTVVHKQASVATGTATGTATSGTATTLVDSGQAWTEDDLIGAAVMITGGTGKGQVVEITDNDATSLTVASWTTQPDNTSTYALVAATALTRDTDYSVDTVYGTVKPLSGGAVAADDVLHGFVTSYAITGTRFRGATKDAVTFRLRGKGKDIKTGALGFLTVHRAVAYASEAQDFVANAESPAFKTLSLSGELETPSGETEPYTWDDNLTYATA